VQKELEAEKSLEDLKSGEEMSKIVINIKEEIKSPPVEEVVEESYKYAISKWRINKNRDAFQIAEIGFNDFVVGSQFYVSCEGKYLFYFTGGREESGESRIQKVIVIDSLTLEKVREAHIPRQQNTVLT